MRGWTSFVLGAVMSVIACPMPARTASPPPAPAASAPATISDHDFAVIFQLRRKVQENPYNPDRICDLAAALEKVKRSGEAEELYRKALGMRSDHPTALRAVAMAHLRRRELEPAMRLFRKLYDRDPRDSQVNAAIGQIYFEMKRFATAVRFFRQALVGAPGENLQRLATIQLTKCLAETGQRDQVEKLYRDLRQRRKRDAIEVYDYLQKLGGAIATGTQATASVELQDAEAVLLESQVLRDVIQAEVASASRDPFKTYVLQEEFVRNPDDDDNSSETVKRVRHEMLPEARQAVSHFVDRNREAASMAASLQLPWNLSLISHREQSEIFSQGKAGWKEFFKRYPGSTGIIGCSRPGFAPDLQLCLLYFEWRWGASEGIGKVLMLERIDERWTIIDQIPLWKY